MINLFLDEDVLSSRVAHKKEREFFRKNCDDISCGIWKLHIKPTLYTRKSLLYAIFVYNIYLFFCTLKTHTEYVIYFIIQIAKRFDSLNAQMPLTNDHFKRLSVTYEWPLNYECLLNYEWPLNYDVTTYHSCNSFWV